MVAERPSGLPFGGDRKNKCFTLIQNQMNNTKDQIKHSTATDGKPPVVGSGIDWDYVMIYVSMVAFAVIWVIAMLI